MRAHAFFEISRAATEGFSRLSPASFVLVTSTTRAQHAASGSPGRSAQPSAIWNTARERFGRIDFNGVRQ